MDVSKWPWKKWFQSAASAGVAAGGVASLFAWEGGCSSTVTCAALCDDACEAAGQPKDAALDNTVVGPDLGDASGCAVPSVPTVAEYDKRFSGWLPSVWNPSACSESEIGTVMKDITYSDLLASLTPPCASCLFTITDPLGKADASPSWQEYVVTYDGSGSLVDVADNEFGACLSALVSPSCGKAQFYLDECLRDVCFECAQPDDWLACIAGAGADECKPVFGAGIASACGAAYAAAHERCVGPPSATFNEQLLAAARALCGPAADAGSDGGSGDDAGDGGDGG